MEGFFFVCVYADTALRPHTGVIPAVAFPQERDVKIKSVFVILQEADCGLTSFKTENMSNVRPY